MTNVKYTNNKRVMVVNCVRPSETEEKKYHHNTVIAAVFDIVYGRLYFITKTPQAEAKGTSVLMYRTKPFSYCFVPYKVDGANCYNILIL